jgi:hypothetical protein
MVVVVLIEATTINRFSRTRRGRSLISDSQRIVSRSGASRTNSSAASTRSHSRKNSNASTERNDLVVRIGLGQEQNKPLQLSKAFREKVGRRLGIKIPKEASWWTDYHISWIGFTTKQMDKKVARAASLYEFCNKMNEHSAGRVIRMHLVLLSPEKVPDRITAHWPKWALDKNGEVPWIDSR